MSADYQPSEYVTVPEGWSCKRLADCTQDGAISYGIVQPGQHDESGVPVIRVNNISNGQLDLSEVLRVSPEIEEKYKRTRLQGGEVLLTLVGSTGQSFVAPAELAGWNVPRAIAVIRASEDVGADWINICLQSKETMHFLNVRANTTVQKTLNLKDVRDIPILIPPYGVKKSIENVALSLSEKVELNQQINQTLEQMAQAIFKSWFVDFEPVKAKIEALEAGGSEDDALLAAMQAISGKDPQQLTQLQTESPEYYTTLRTTAELFPAAMQESELGKIPEGWFLPSFEELTTAKQGRYLSKDKMLTVANEEFKVPVWGGNGILGYAEKSAYSSPVVLMTCRGSNCGLIKYTESASWVSNNSFACTPCIGSSWFLLNYFQLSTFEDCISGSAQPQITHTALKTKQLRFPVQKQLCERYSEIINPIFDHILQLKKEIITLEETRDTLLPKLLSGELSVNQDAK